MAHTIIPLHDRILAKVREEDRGHETPCWIFTGALNNRGYGTANSGVRRRGKWVNVLTHRAIYVHYRGMIPAGLQIDHLCRVAACCNPDHLEAVTQAENWIRGESPPARRKRQTHCQHGHEFTPENTYVSSKGHRSCRQCRRDSRGCVARTHGV